MFHDKYIFTCLLFLSVIIPSYSIENPNINLTASADSIIPNEPLSITIEYLNIAEDSINNKTISILINDIMIEQPLISGQFQETSPGVFRILYELFYNFRKHKLIFENPGENRIQIIDSSNNAKSNIVIINVKSPSDEDVKTQKLFCGSEKHIRAYMVHEFSDNIIKEYQNLISKYPKSPFAPYASVSLGIYFLRSIGANPDKRNDENEIKNIIKYFENADNYTKRSILREKAKYYYALCNGKLKHYDIAMNILVDLRNEYPDGKFIIRVHKLVDEINQNR